MTDPSDALKAALVAQLDAFSNPERQQPGDLSVAEYAALKRMSLPWALRTLRAAMQAGVVTEHKVILNNGHAGNVYRAVAKAG